MLSPREPVVARRLIARWALNIPGAGGASHVSMCRYRPTGGRQTLYSGPHAIAFFLRPYVGPSAPRGIAPDPAEVMVVNSRIFSAVTSQHQREARGAAWGRAVLDIPYARPTDTLRMLADRCAAHAGRHPDDAARMADCQATLRAAGTIHTPLD